jgi:sialate O-acetylesterase
MVLQQNDTVTLWGWTTHTTEEITVTGDWNMTPVKTKAYHGMWEVKLATTKAGGPYKITIKGHKELVLSNVMLGEVWLASGQSNMQWSSVHGFDNAKEEVSLADYPNIRLFNVPQVQSATRQLDLPAEWEECSPESVKEFSAVAYFFARHLHKNLDVPIGIINSSWGGTNAEVWVEEKVVNDDPELLEALSAQGVNPWKSRDPAYMFNSMIAPLIPFEIAGAIWYQGESNRVAPHSYTKLFTGLIDNWRDNWGYNFPFYYVQIAPFKYKEKDAGVMIRQAQLEAMKHNNVGMVVVSDIGNINNIHPGNKQDVGKRLGNWALAKTYNKAGIVYSGPLYKQLDIKKNKAIISFDYAESGLMMKGKKLTHFEIAGADQKFVKAKAKISGNTVIVTSKQVKQPVAVRFAWDNIAEPNLFNQEGLPASAFRTDDWEIKITNN